MTEEATMLRYLSEIEYQLGQATRYAAMAYGRQIDSANPTLWIKAMREAMLKADGIDDRIAIMQQEEEQAHAAE